jgi:hypothetical protein
LLKKQLKQTPTCATRSISDNSNTFRASGTLRKRTRLISLLRQEAQRNLETSDNEWRARNKSGKKAVFKTVHAHNNLEQEHLLTSWGTSISVYQPTRNNGMYKTDDLTSKGQVLWGNRLQTRHLQHDIEPT